MNMQNIPSHATDIRHIFRATPEQDEVMKLTENEGQITLKLSKYDSVPNTEGFVKVTDLTTDSIVVLKDREQDVQFSVSSISFDKGTATIILIERKEV